MNNRLANSDSPIDKIVTIQKFETDGKLKILRGYAGGGFQVNDEFISGSIILLRLLAKYQTIDILYWQHKLL